MRTLGFFGALLVGALLGGCSPSSNGGGGAQSLSDAATFGDDASAASDGGEPHPDGSDVIDAEFDASRPEPDLIFKLVPPATSFDVQTAVVSNAGLASSVVMLASQGYVATATTPLASGSQLWAFSHAP
jgi:hypothetical protein